MVDMKLDRLLSNIFSEYDLNTAQNFRQGNRVIGKEILNENSGIMFLICF